MLDGECTRTCTVPAQHRRIIDDNPEPADLLAPSAGSDPCLPTHRVLLIRYVPLSAVL